MAAKTSRDFFICYTQADRPWAEWVAWQLEEEGYAVIIQAWDFAVGANLLARMDVVLKESGRTLLILTPAALASRYVRAEWAAALHQKRLTPVRVRECELAGLLRSHAYIDLVGLKEAAARARLLAGLCEGQRGKLEQVPSYPGAPSKADRRGPPRPVFPGALPPFWRVPYPRNPFFTGRETLLTALRQALTSGTVAALTQVLAGLGGVGKTQIALEYSYRHAQEYGGVWWLRAETPETLVADCAALAEAAQIPERERADREAAVEAARRWLAEQPRPWLLVFNNAPGPESLRGYRPQSRLHHVLITTRNPAFGGVARRLEVKVFERAEAIAFLIERTGREERPAAGALAKELGDLPLALEQAGAYMDTARLSIADYLARYRAHRAQRLTGGAVSTDYPDTVATTWSLAFETVVKTAPAAAALLNLLAFLAPEAIPKALIVDGGGSLPAELTAAVADGLALDEAVAALRSHSLIKTTGDQWWVHRLVQAVTRDRLGDGAVTWAEAAVEMMNDAFAYQRDDLATWAPSEALLPHALAAAAHAEALGVELEATSRLLNKAGVYLKDRAQLGEARSALERALIITEQVYGPEHAEVAIRAGNLGQMLQDQGDLAGALGYAQRALAIAEQVYGPEHAEVAVRAGNLGQILKAQGDLPGALGYAQRALTIDGWVYGSEHPAVAIRANNVGQILQDQGDLAGALSYAQRALAIDERVYGPEHPTVVRDASNLGQIVRAQGDLAGALGYARRALVIAERVYGPEHPTVATLANNLGQIMEDLGDLAGALGYAQRALAIDERVYGSEHPTVARDANNLGQILRAQGDFEEAWRYLQRALGIFRNTLGPHHPDTRVVAANLASLRKNRR